MRGLLIVAIGLTGAAAVAGEVERLFLEMRYEEALEAAGRSLASPGMGPEELVEAYKWKGLCLATLGRSEQAVRVFLELLSIDPSFSLSGDSGYSPTQVLPFYQAAKARQDRGHQPICLEHVPPVPVSGLRGLILEVELKSDPLGMVSGVQLGYRGEQGACEDRMAVSVKGPGRFRFRLPDSFAGEELHYRFEAVNRYGGVLARVGSAGDPIHLRAVSETAGPTRMSALSTWGWVVSGLGGALLAGGAICGGMALSLDGNLSADCPGGVCPRGRSGDLERLDSLVLSTDILLAAGAAVLAAGVVMLLLDPGVAGDGGTVSVVPSAGEGFLGASVLGRF